MQLAFIFFFTTYWMCGLTLSNGAIIFALLTSSAELFCISFQVARSQRLSIFNCACNQILGLCLL